MLSINSYSKTLLAVAGILATAGNLFAQQYTIAPNDSIVANAPFDDLTHFNITQPNVSGQKLVLSWQQVYLSIPQGWTANLCDNGHCYTDFPLSGTMDTVYSDGYGLMSAGIDPGQTSGTAMIRYALWEAATPEHKDTLTWIITSGNTTGTAEASMSPVVSLYPNPSQNNIYITTRSALDFTLTDLTGKQILSGTLKAGFNTIDTRQIPGGNYFISAFANNTTKIFTQSLIIQH